MKFVFATATMYTQYQRIIFLHKIFAFIMKKSEITLEQGFLFTEKPRQVKNLSKQASPYKSAPNTTLLAGLDKTNLKTEGVYLLRVLANQHSRALPAAQAKKGILKTIIDEIHLKQGKIPLELAVMNSLLRRHYPD